MQSLRGIFPKPRKWKKKYFYCLLACVRESACECLWLAVRALFIYAFFVVLTYQFVMAKCTFTCTKQTNKQTKSIDGINYSSNVALKTVRFPFENTSCSCMRSYVLLKHSHFSFSFLFHPSPSNRSTTKTGFHQRKCKKLTINATE